MSISYETYSCFVCHNLHPYGYDCPEKHRFWSCTFCGAYHPRGRKCDSYEKIEYLNNRLEKLYELINMEDRITACDVMLRLTKAEDNIERLEMLKSGKKPHKCLVCAGSGKIYIQPELWSSIFEGMLSECKACEGKAIIWI